MLGFFKYYGFFVESLDDLLGPLGSAARACTCDIVLPVGISFYTFQAMSYTIDVYRREIRATRSLLDFALFVAFFPHLVAGPIERAAIPAPDRAPRRLSRAAFVSGCWLILWGLLKKVVIADNLAAHRRPHLRALGHRRRPARVSGVVAFAFQIYCDFSGYSDIARGVARLLGFELMLNFNLPYFATNPSDFWRRWHISLSTWLRDYLYIPLGGNRGEATTYRNLCSPCCWAASGTARPGTSSGGAPTTACCYRPPPCAWRAAGEPVTVVSAGGVGDRDVPLHAPRLAPLPQHRRVRVDGLSRDDSSAQIVEMLTAFGHGLGLDAASLELLLRWPSSPAAADRAMDPVPAPGPLVVLRLPRWPRGGDFHLAADVADLGNSGR